MKVFFPYERVRKEQEEIIKKLAYSLESKKACIFEAPSGIGKTVAVLSVIMPFVKERGLKVFYMCRTHTQMTRVIEELRRMYEKGFKVDGIMLKGKSDMCFVNYIKRMPYRMMIRACDRMRATLRCPYYVEFKKLIRQGLFKKLYYGIYHADDILRISKEMKICPYELGIELARRATLVTLSYMYLVDQELRKILLSTFNIGLEDAIVIVDEAHNILDVATEVESLSIDLKTVKEAITCLKKIRIRRVRSERAKELARLKYPIIKGLQTIKEILLERGVKEQRYEPKEFTEDFERKTKQSLLIYIDYLAEYIRGITQGKYCSSLDIISLELISDFLRKLLDTWNDERYIHIISTEGENVKYSIICIDPGIALEPILHNAYFTIHMSATLSPLEDYVEILDIKDVEVFKVEPSYKGRVKGLIVTGVTTAYGERSESMYRRIAEIISYITNMLDGNIAVFVPSYEVLRNIRAFIKSTKKVFEEKQGESTLSLEKKIQKFKSMWKKGGAILIGVLGGRACEGVDYPGRELEILIIVGVPYPEPNAKVYAQRKYYSVKYGEEKAFRYVSVLPAMRKVNQAIGRLVRGPLDYGVVILADERYLKLRYYVASWVELLGVYHYTQVEEITNVVKEILREYRLDYHSS